MTTAPWLFLASSLLLGCSNGSGAQTFTGPKEGGTEGGQDATPVDAGPVCLCVTSNPNVKTNTVACDPSSNVVFTCAEAGPGFAGPICYGNSGGNACATGYACAPFIGSAGPQGSATYQAYDDAGLGWTGTVKCP